MQVKTEGVPTNTLKIYYGSNTNLQFLSCPDTTFYSYASRSAYNGYNIILLNIASSNYAYFAVYSDVGGINYEITLTQGEKFF